MLCGVVKCILSDWFLIYDGSKYGPRMMKDALWSRVVHYSLLIDNMVQHGSENCMIKLVHCVLNWVKDVTNPIQNNLKSEQLHTLGNNDAMKWPAKVQGIYYEWIRAILATAVFNVMILYMK